jgi:hypothetical protein
VAKKWERTSGVFMRLTISAVEVIVLVVAVAVINQIRGRGGGRFF